MKVRFLCFIATLALVGVMATPAHAAGDSRVTRDDTPGSYLRYDGSSDDTTEACSTGKRSQNEPAIAVDPRDTTVLVAGSNDYCAATVNGDVWAGYYRSTDGGASWQDSLVPGYPADVSPAGLASPAHGKCGAAGDPTQSFDREGRLFYGFICFNRVKPINGSIYVATYDQDGANYVRTSLVARGTPSGLFGVGLFQDKVNLAVDQTNGPHAGNIYVAWARFTATNPNNLIQFSRSTDHGVSFSKAVNISRGVLGGKQFADVAVGPDGAVYVTFLSYQINPQSVTGVWVVKSTNGGRTFGTPVLVSRIVLFDSDQFSGGSGQVDCGDGIFFACPSGLTFSRFGSLGAVAADETGVHVVWSGRDADRQAKIFASNSPNGGTWSHPEPLDSVPVGHQWFPDIASADGVMSVVFYDSRNDAAYSPDLPPGNTASGVNSGDVVQTFAAQSTDGGVTWTENQITSAGSNFGWETHGSRRVGFWGDYNYVSAVPGAVVAAWTDSRDLVPGVDPRETGEDDDHDGFDVLQPCQYIPNDIDAPSYSSPLVNDPCLSMGGLDQNIYAGQI